MVISGYLEAMLLTKLEMEAPLMFCGNLMAQIGPGLKAQKLGMH